MTCAYCGQQPHYAPIRVHNKVFCSLSHLDLYMKSHTDTCNHPNCTATLTVHERQLHPLDGYTAEL